MTKAFVCNPGEGERMWFLGGGLHEWKATADQTGGSLFALDDEIDAEKVTPLHTHPKADEAVLVVEGEIEVHQAGEVSRVTAGGFLFTPRGVPHAFRGIAPHSRLFCVQTPGAGDVFYRQASEPLADGESTGRVDFDVVGQAAKATRATVILGPPPFATTP